MTKTLLAITTTLLASSLTMAQTGNYPIGSTVADFTVTDVTGTTHSLYDYTSQGKYVILDFFFAACGPCQATSPYFNQLHETYGCNAHDLVCLTINNGNDNDAQVVAYEEQHGGSYAHCPAISNEGGGEAVNNAFGVNAFPTYCLIGPDNIMVDNDIWPISAMSDFVAALPSAVQPADCLVGITDKGIIARSSIYPSPSNGQVTISAHAMGSGIATLEIYDVVGQHIRSIPLGATTGGDLERSIDLSTLTDGQYMCAIMGGNGERSVQRLIIAH